MKVIRKRSILAAAVAAIVALGLFIRYSPVVAQDACLDGGGAWHDGRCVH